MQEINNIVQKTKALWRKLSPVENNSKKKFNNISSWSDLDKLKIKYRTQVLKSKSRQKIFQQNMQIIQTLQQTAPKVDAWSYIKLKRSPRSSSNQLMLKNFELIQKIQQTQPKIDSWNRYKPKQSPRSKSREQQKMRLFEQNMKIIQRVQSVSPKVQNWNRHKPKKNQKLLSQRRHFKQKLFEQNMKLIEKVQGAPPKIDSWADIKNMRKLVQRKKLQNLSKSCQTITRMQKFIENAQRKLIEQDRKLMHDERKIKTLPNISSHSKQKIRQHKKNVDRLTLKIQKSKASINCWPSRQQQNKHLNKGIKILKLENKNSGILQKAKKIKQLKYMNRNLQFSKIVQKYK